MKVLVFVDYYLPGFKGGGPVHSVSRLVKALAGEIDFYIFTRDRDLGDTAPYEGVTTGDWSPSGSTCMFYAEPDQLDSRSILQAIRDVQPDVIYVNSYFSKLTRAVLNLRARGKLRGVAVLVAPRGEFSPGALALKAGKKRAYLAIARLAGLHRRLTWHLSSDRELADARAAISSEPHSFIKPPDVAIVEVEPSSRQKTSGTASFAFISRVSPKKNVLGAIEMLASARGQVTFTIYGPIEDASYWAACEKAIGGLPTNVRCEYAGAIHPSDVVAKLSRHHFFLCPTLGENFGHVIAEALTAGCPALLSDQTPWAELEEKRCGWITPLTETGEWLAKLQQCVEMDGEEFAMMSRNAVEHMRALADESASATESKRMFETALAYERAA